MWQERVVRDERAHVFATVFQQAAYSCERPLEKDRAGGEGTGKELKQVSPGCCILVRCEETNTPGEKLRHRHIKGIYTPCSILLPKTGTGG